MRSLHFGKCIHTSPSGFKVYDNFRYRWLTFGTSAYQTVINRRHPDRAIMGYIPALTLMTRQAQGDCCMFGLGGAATAHFITKYQPDINLLAVEKSEEVITIANTYFMAKELKNLSIVNQDAMEFVQQYPRKYRHLIIDLYDANQFPKECANHEFFSACTRILDSDGFLAINLANSNEHWPILELIRQSFNATIVIPIHKRDNMVIIATHNDSRSFLVKHLEKCTDIKKMVWDMKWGLMGLL